MTYLQFANETLLRQALVKLLMRIPKIRDVQLTHGTNEFGKDITFWTTGPLGEPLPCACVVKNTRISGSVDKLSGARNVLTQAQQALDTPFLDVQGHDQSIQRVYVVSPETISQISIASIRGSLKDKAGSITFIPGEKLFELFRSFWPDFLVDEFAILEQHLATVDEVSLVSELHELTNIYGLPAPEELEETVYVERTLARELLINIDDQLILDPVPTTNALQFTRWQDQDLKSRIQFLHNLTDIYDHLASWSLLTHSESHTDLLGSIKLFSRSLTSELIMAEGRQSLSLSDDDPNSETQPTIQLFLDAKTITLAASLRPKLIDLLQPLRIACQQLKVIQGSTIPHHLLETPEAKATARLTDCLALAPASLLESKESLIFTLSEADLRQTASSWLLVGPAGHGKTAFCRWNALLDAQLFRSGASEYIPVYVPLNTLARRELKNYKDAFLRTAGVSALLGDGGSDPEVSAGEMHLRLYLDGLDEVPTSTKRDQILSLAKDAYTHGIQVFLTARDYLNLPQLDWLMRLELTGLDEQEQLELFSRTLPSSSAVESFQHQVESSGSLKEILRVPLIARLTLLIFRQTGTVAQNRTQLYRTFIDLLSGGWDLAKGLLRHSHFGRVEKRIALCKIAGVAHEKRQRYFQSRLLTDAVAKVTNAMSSADRKALLRELLRDGLIARSAETYYFSHLSFQEYLCALLYFGSQERGRIEAAIEEYLNGDDWWREVIRFYIGLSENPEELSHWLAIRLRTRHKRSLDLWEIFSESFPTFQPTMA